jgi:hypothetical protein
MLLSSMSKRERKERERKSVMRERERERERRVCDFIEKKEKVLKTGSNSVS